MNVSSIAASALVSAGTATAVRANNIVNVQTQGFKAQTPVYSTLVTGGVAVFAQDTANPTNLVSEAVGLIAGTAQYKAATRLIAVDDEMHKAFMRAVAA
jgi:flagellar basal body rod protein FlgG